MSRRGFRRALYVMDDGQQWALLVDADSIDDPARGWVELADSSLPFAPRGFLPRRMVGRDETGRQRTTRVATVTCDLWNFVVSSWSLEGSDGVPHVVSATNRNAERQIGPRLQPPEA